MSLTFTKQILALQNVKRFHMEDLLRTQTVAEHSFNVALIAWTMAVWYVEHYQSPDKETVRPNFLLMSALLHDLEESLTGDADYVAKQYIEGPWKQMEEELSAQMFKQFDPGLKRCIEGHRNLSDLETKIVRMADYLEFIHFTLSEARRGNRNGSVLARKGFSVLEKYDHPVFHVLDCPFAQFKAYLKQLLREYERDKRFEEVPILRRVLFSEGKGGR